MVGRAVVWWPEALHHVAAEPEATDLSGRLVLDRRARPFDRIPSTRVSPADRRRLWDAVVQLAGIADPLPDRTSIGVS